jgi:hypothetical protein
VSTAISPFTQGDTYVEDGTVTMNVSQQIVIEGTPTAGTFTITRSGETTATIAFNANAAAVQTALEGLRSVNVGDVTVSGGPGPGTAWTVTDNTVSPKALTVASSLSGGTNVQLYVLAGAYDLTGCTLRWTLKTAATLPDASAAIRHTWIAGVASGIVVSSPTTGRFVHTITAIESGSLTVGVSYVWDLQLADTSTPPVVKTVLDGTLSVTQGVTITSP